MLCAIVVISEYKVTNSKLYQGVPLNLLPPHSLVCAQDRPIVLADQRKPTCVIALLRWEHALMALYYIPLIL